MSENEAHDETLTCWLCERPVGSVTQWHHPVPKSKKGRAKVPIHPICHKAIHANFTNSELARIGDNASLIRGNGSIAKFIAWVANKPADFDAPTR